MRWQNGYPCDQGSTDGQDSARLAGIMWVFNHPLKLPYLAAYCKYTGGFKSIYYVRHPKEGNLYEFSRDQAVCLFAGLFISGRGVFVNQNYNPPNDDWISPSVRGHFLRCSGREANWFQDLWLWFDVLWSCYVNNFITTEVNQLVCMLMVHPNKKYLRFWRTNHRNWSDTIQYYWCGWRGEPELAELMIKTIKEV